MSLKCNACISNSPVVLLEGCLLNHAIGLSLFAMLPPDAVPVVCPCSDAACVADEDPVDFEFPHPTKPTVTIAAVAILMILFAFMCLSLLEKNSILSITFHRRTTFTSTAPTILHRTQETLPLPHRVLAWTIQDSTSSFPGLS